MTIKRRKKNIDNNYERLVAQESLVLEVTEEICRALESEEVTRKELAQRLGRSKGFVSQLLSGERNMTLRTVADLATALGYRFRVEAVPSSGRRCNAPLYFHPGTLDRGRLHSVDIDLGPSALGGFSKEWAQAQKKHGGASDRYASAKPDRWSPATQGFECVEAQSGRPEDHEFSLTA